MHLGSFELNLKHLDNVLSGLRRAGIQLRADKCRFAYKEVEFLGHLISEGGRRPLPATIPRIAFWPRSSKKNYVRRFMGLVNWYREYVPGIAKLVLPLHRLTKKAILGSGRQSVKQVFLN